MENAVLSITDGGHCARDLMGLVRERINVIWWNTAQACRWGALLTSAQLPEPFDHPKDSGLLSLAHQSSDNGRVLKTGSRLRIVSGPILLFKWFLLFFQSPMTYINLFSIS